MSKHTKINGLNENEVQYVADMQHKIDFYERFIMEIWCMIVSKRDRRILKDDLSNDMTSDIYRFVKNKIADGK